MTKGKNLNKRLRELRLENEYKPVFIIDQYVDLLRPELKKKGRSLFSFRGFKA